MAIFDEQVLEPFVAKGLGNSGIASRQIQATNLPDLSAAVRQSQETQRNLEDQQKMLAKSQSMVNISKALSGGRGGGEDSKKPFVIGRTKSTVEGAPGGITVAIPTNKGFQVKTFLTNSLAAGPADPFAQSKRQLESLGISLDGNYPELKSTVMQPGEFSKERLRDFVLAYSQPIGAGKIDISRFA